MVFTALPGRRRWAEFSLIRTRALRPTSRRAVWWLAACFLLLGTGSCDSWLTSPSRLHAIDVSTVTRGGAAVAGVKLLLYTGIRPMDYATTDAAGHARFSNVPDGEYGVAVIAVPDGFHVRANGGGALVSYRDGLTVGTGAPIALAFTLLKNGPGTVIVTIAKPDGTPLPGIPTSLLEESGIGTGLVTDPNGKVVFSAVPYGTYYAAVENPEFSENTSMQRFVTSRALFVDDGSRDSVRLTISPCIGAVTARVFDTSSRPVSGFALRLYTSTAILQEVKTDANGSFTFTPLQCGEYGVALLPTAGYTFTDAVGISYNSGKVTRASSTTYTFTVRPA